MPTIHHLASTRSRPTAGPARRRHRWAEHPSDALTPDALREAVGRSIGLRSAPSEHEPATSQLGGLIVAAMRERAGTDDLAAWGREHGATELTMAFCWRSFCRAPGHAGAAGGWWRGALHVHGPEAADAEAQAHSAGDPYLAAFVESRYRASLRGATPARSSLSRLRLPVDAGVLRLRVAGDEIEIMPLVVHVGATAAGSGR